MPDALFASTSGNVLMSVVGLVIVALAALYFANSFNRSRRDDLTVVRLTGEDSRRVTRLVSRK